LKSVIENTMNKTEISPLQIKCKERPLMVMDMADWDQHAKDDPDALLHRLGQWAGRTHWQLLSAHKGHIVKSMPYGLMMEFADARSCLRAAFALNQLAESANARVGLKLRAGAHLASYTHSGDEITGRDVKLTSGLTALANPGEVIVTAELREQLADGVDAVFEDLGYQRVKPLANAVHLYRAYLEKEDALDWQKIQPRDVRPGLAVIPFKGEVDEEKRWMLGELIAEGVIARLSHCIGLRVISRQSTTTLRGSALGQIERHLGATFVLSGSYSLQGRRLVVSAELVEARSHTLLWSGELHGTVDDLLQEESELLYDLAHKAAQTLGHTRVRKAVAQSLPRLDSSSLLLSVISMRDGHSAKHSKKTFERGREALTELTTRHPELALPRAWLGMWHTLSVVKGHSADVARDTQRAREQTQRALEAEPHNAMALAVEGYINCQLLGNPEQARKFLDAAIEANPSEPMAWLFRSLFSAMWDSSSLAVTEAHIARAFRRSIPCGTSSTC
jgi:adenylate cyclase